MLWQPVSKTYTETERLPQVADNLMKNFNFQFQEGIQERENSTKLLDINIKFKIKENQLYEWICENQHG